MKLPFYLTGGTALSRYYFKHRYSDDLDLFVNSDALFANYCKQLTENLINQSTELFRFIPERFVKSEDYTQIFVERGSVILKIDLVNDVKFHYGDFIEDNSMGKIDNWRNILSNKITAAFRMEIKDFIDIWIICRNKSLNWIEIFEEAKRKDPGVDPISLSDLFRSFPFENISLIKWITLPEIEELKKDFNEISNNILYGTDNSIYQV